MLPSTPRIRRNRPFLKLVLAASASFALVSFAGAAPALASEASCEGQVFTQPFKLLGNLNYYTLVPGGEFNAEGEGWQLSGEARTTEATRPYGLSGGVLELPPGAEAVSPSECVTSAYPTAAIFLRRAQGFGDVKVFVSYAGTRSELKPKRVGLLHTHASWELEEFEVEPQLGGSTEETHEVQFVFRTRGVGTTYEAFGFYVDPRMI